MHAVVGLLGRMIQSQIGMTKRLTQGPFLTYIDGAIWGGQLGESRLSAEPEWV